MTLSRSTLKVGEGRLSGASLNNGIIEFFIETDGAIFKRTMPQDRRGISSEGIVSYADEYIKTELSKVSLMGNEIEIEVRD